MIIIIGSQIIGSGASSGTGGAPFSQQFWQLIIDQWQTINTTWN